LIVIWKQVLFYPRPVFTPSYSEEVIEKMRSKKLLNPLHFESNPYHDSSVSHRLAPEFYQQACGLRYVDDDKISYTLTTFANVSEALSSKHIVTHMGPCGACSSTQDLALYMELKDLTNPGVSCALQGMIAPSLGISCFVRLGLTTECATVWYYNTVNTKEKCGGLCMYYNVFLRANECTPEGRLNPCIQCDEDHSGPIFLAYAGRNRRNSGLESSICRPADQITNIRHNYY
jgi:hypothetical protein